MVLRALLSVYKQIGRLSYAAPAASQALSRSYRPASSAEKPFSLKNYGYWSKGNPGIKAGSLLASVNRRVISDRAHKRWDRRLRHHIPGSEMKVLQRKESERLRARRRFKTLVSYILKRRERGF